jgi:hypothetical protein
MRRLAQSAALSVLFLLGANTAIADVQYYSPMGPQSPTVPSAAPQPVVRPKYPPSWYYDPYTNGSTTCPQGGEQLEPKCNVLIPPSYPER